MTTATTTNEAEARQTTVETLARKIKLSWKKLADDSGCTDDEKASAKQHIEKLLTKYELKINWKTGKITDARQQQAEQEPVKEQPKAEAKPKKEKTKAEGIWTTADLASYLSTVLGKEITAKNLRRHLRTMERYNDGKMTHYAWTGQNDPLVKEVIESIKAKKAS